MASEEQQPLLAHGHSPASGSARDLESGAGARDERRNEADPVGPGEGEDGEEEEEEEEEKQLSRREWMAETLESRAVHKAVITLIVIDAACVLADLVYTFLSDDACPGPSPTLLPSLPSSPSLALVSLDSEREAEPAWLAVLSHLSLAITTIFLLEIPLHIWAFGWSFYLPLSRKYAMSSLHCFDALVIVTTFVLEVVLRGREQELVGLLILFRLWRLVKLVGGIAVGAGEMNEELIQQLSEVEEQLRERTEVLRRTQDENAHLRQRLAAAGFNDFTSP